MNGLRANLTPLFLMVLALFALSMVTFIYSFVQAVSSRYQESTLLIGVGFIILAFAVFTYRVYRYPDRMPEPARND